MRPISHQFVMVTVAERQRLIRLTDIREIVSLMALAEVEGRRDRCRGMANLRGEMIPVFDLSGPDTPLSPTRMIVVAHAFGDTVGLLVDDVHDVVAVPEDRVALRPVGGGRAATVVRLGDEIFSVMEVADAVRDDG